VLKAAHDAEEFYEDRGARISILAGRKPPRPDTLKQTDQPPISTKPLADGAGHTFSTVFARCRRSTAGARLGWNRAAVPSITNVDGQGTHRRLGTPHRGVASRAASKASLSAVSDTANLIAGALAMWAINT
jgi:hypothetical protein